MIRSLKNVGSDVILSVHPLSGSAVFWVAIFCMSYRLCLVLVNILLVSEVTLPRIVCTPNCTFLQQGVLVVVRVGTQCSVLDVPTLVTLVVGKE